MILLVVLSLVVGQIIYKDDSQKIIEACKADQTTDFCKKLNEGK